MEYGSWNKQLLIQTFLPHEVEAIISLSIGQQSQEDRLIWHYAKNGVYSVKSGYHVAYEERAKSKGNRSEATTSTANKKAWSFIWSLKTPPKIKAFVWRIATDSLPVGSNLLKRKLNSGMCCICGDDIETWRHCLFECKWTKELWKEIKDVSIVTSTNQQFLDICFELYVKKPPWIELFFFLLWFAWLGRNRLVFYGVPPDPRRILLQATSLLEECNKAQSNFSDLNHKAPPANKWMKPPLGAIKVNVDAVFRDGNGSAGILIRDDMGTLIVAFSVNLGLISSVEEAEMKAILLGTKEAARIWSDMVIVESDSQICIRQIEDDDEILLPLRMPCLMQKIPEAQC